MLCSTAHPCKNVGVGKVLRMRNSLQKETKEIRNAEFQKEVLEVDCASNCKSDIIVW